MRILLFVALISLASANTLRFRVVESGLTEQWEMFKTTHGKQYESTEHETLRRIVWEENMRYIQRHNFEADMGKHTYRLGMNEYGDLTHEEFRKVFLGFAMNATRSASSSTFLPASNIQVPDTVDWRKEGYVTKVKNQKQCGSCWAFSTTGSLEGQNFKKTKKLVSLSEQNLVDCSKKFGNKGCQGGLMDNAFKYIKSNGGIDTEDSYPYTARNGRCKFSKNNVGATDTGFVDVKSGSESDLQNAVATIGPISVAIDASHQSFQLYRSGVYSPMICSSVRLDHGVLAVGYGTDQGKDYWLVKNSWGESWGMDGYIMMVRNKKNKCGIATQASYPLV